MAPIDLPSQFLFANRHLSSIDHDNEISGIKMGDKIGFVLPSQQFGHFTGKAAKDHATGIYQMPLPGDVCWFGTVSQNSSSKVIEFMNLVQFVHPVFTKFFNFIHFYRIVKGKNPMSQPGLHPKEVAPSD